MRDDAHCCTSKLILSADAQIATFANPPITAFHPASMRRRLPCRGDAVLYHVLPPNSSRSVLQTLSPRKNGRGPVEKAAGAATRPR